MAGNQNKNFKLKKVMRWEGDGRGEHQGYNNK